MNHKCSKPNLINLLLAAAVMIGFFMSGAASAAGSDRNDLMSSNDRLPTSTRDLLPELDGLTCTPQCTGQSAACGQEKTLDGCLAQSSTQGCFWSCD